MNALYAKLYSIPYYSKIAKRLLGALGRRLPTTQTIPPRLSSRRPTLEDYGLCADAIIENNRRFAAPALFGQEQVLFSSAIRDGSVLRSNEFQPLVDYFQNTSLIPGLQFHTVTISSSQLSYLLIAKSIAIYIYNNASSDAITKGSSACAGAHRFVATFGCVASIFSISLWFGRVPSSWNCSDAPSRNRALPFSVGRYCAFDSIAEWLSLQESSVRRPCSQPIPHISDAVNTLPDLIDARADGDPPEE